MSAGSSTSKLEVITWCEAAAPCKSVPRKSSNSVLALAGQGAWAGEGDAAEAEEEEEEEEAVFEEVAVAGAAAAAGGKRASSSHGRG